MKTLKSLLRLASYHWWAYKKRRQMEPVLPPVESTPPMPSVKEPEDKRNHFLRPVVGGGVQHYVYLKCNHCGQISLKTAPPNIEEIYDWCPICSRKNHYIMDGRASFRNIDSTKVLIEAKWIGEGCYEVV